MSPRNQKPTPDPQPWSDFQPWPTDKQALRAEGERRRDAGMSIAASHQPYKVQAAKVAMLDRLLTSPDGTATIDDVTENLGAQFPDGGNWRGSVVRSLASQGVIEKVGVELSNRPSRHRGYITRWQLVDRSKAITLRTRLKAVIDNTTDKSKTPSADSSPKGADDVSNVNDTKDSSNPNNNQED